MPPKRIPELDAITGAQTANDDNLIVFDTSANTTKRILRSQLAAAIAGELPYTPSGGLSSTTIPTAIAELAGEVVRADTLAVWAGLDTVTELLADTTLTYTAGTGGSVTAGNIVRTRAEGFSYEVAGSAAVDHHVTTAGGVKLYVLPGAGGKVAVEAFGDPSLASTWNAAYLAARATGALTGSGLSYTVTGTIIPQNGVELSFPTVVTINRGQPGAPLIRTQGFASYADDVDRSYVWHSSTAARNAQNYATGQYVMVAANSTDFNSATWWQATATPASDDANWIAVEPVVGQVSGAYRNVRFAGGASGGASDVVVGIYGVDIKLDTVKAEGGGIALHTESPGGLFSTQVGRNLQWHVSGIECRHYSHKGWRANHQSDGCNFGTTSYAEVGVTPDLLHIGQKASGQKWLGGHIWGGDTGARVVIDATTTTMLGVEVERPVLVNAGGFQFYGQVYRLKDDAREDVAAFQVAAGVSGCRIMSRVNHFRFPVRVEAATGTGNTYEFTHFSADAAAALFDPTGQTAPDPGKNRWSYVATGQGTSRYSMPFLEAARIRRRRQFIAYAASITPDLSAGDFIEVGPLTGNITINNPINGGEGDEVQFMLGQGTGGGFTLTWGPNFIGGPTAGGAAFTRRAVRFVNDGVRWILCGDSGAWV